jgi:two-component system, NarL family, sensor histidine kinase UhpB
MRRMTLLTQVMVANLLVLLAAMIALAIAASSESGVPSGAHLSLIITIAVAVSLLVNAVITQRRFRPLEQLVEEMERVDLARPGGASPQAPPADDSAPEEVVRLHQAFRVMLGRLEAERRRTSSAALQAQEQERARVARDLHDEVNQALTGLLLRLEAARAKAPPELRRELAETKTLANRAMEELLALARSLRPTALDDLGLRAALAGLVDDVERGGNIEATFESDGELAALPSDVQLVVYRVAQEALSNAVRHSGAGSVRVQLKRAPGEGGDRIELTVRDDGRGFSFDDAARGLGLAGMRERALLVGGEVRVESRPEVGTRVRLSVPLKSG